MSTHKYILEPVPILETTNLDEYADNMNTHLYVQENVCVDVRIYVYIHTWVYLATTHPSHHKSRRMYR